VIVITDINDIVEQTLYNKLNKNLDKKTSANIT